MTPNWHSFLESTEARFAGEPAEPADFGDPAGELQAAAGRTVLAPLTHLAIIEASGDDAKSFLHSQLTSDVNHLADGQLQHAGWCNAKGRMQASFVAWNEAGVYRLAMAADLLAPTLKRLQMFVLRAKVKLTARDDLVLLGVAGPQLGEALADAALAAPDQTMGAARSGEASVLQLDANRCWVAVPETAAPAVWQKLSVKARPVGLPAWRWLDVQAAFPLVSLATKEEFVPQMADFEKIGGVSFHKGCYPGQEIVARTQYLGKVKRHLYRLHCAAPLAAGADLFSPDNLEMACGKVMSAAPAPDGGHVALAVVQANYAGNLRLGSREGEVVKASPVNPD